MMFDKFLFFLDLENTIKLFKIATQGTHKRTIYIGKLCTETGVISSYPVMQVSGERLDYAIGLCHFQSDNHNCIKL
jgi:hypothetical protein